MEGMEKQDERYRLSEEELRAIQNLEEDLVGENAKCVESAIKKQNMLIEYELKQHYIYYVVHFFSDPHNESLLRILVTCMCEYNPMVVRDIFKVFCDMYQVRWKDIGWRKKQFMYHQEKIEDILNP